MTEKVTKLESTDNLLNESVKFATKIFKESGSLTPQVVSYPPSGIPIVTVVPDLGDRKTGGRESSLEFLRILHVAHNVNRYVVMHEAWASVPIEDPYKKYESLEEDPDRKEVLITMIITRKEKKGFIHEIIRDNDKITLGEQGKAMAVDGRFTELLPPVNCPKKFVEMAKAILEQEQSPDNKK